MVTTSHFDYLRSFFSASLHDKIKKQNTTVTKLAKSTGISRSVLSSYVSGGAGLPNALNIFRLSQALHCDPGIFFPKDKLSSEVNIETETDQIYSLVISNSQVFDMIKKIEPSNGQFIYYVPQTLPEPLKTSAICTLEYPMVSELDLRAHIKTMRSMTYIPLNGVVLIAEETLLDILKLRSTYYSLSPEAANEQIQFILTACHKLFPHLQIKVFSRQKHNINPCFLNCGSFLLVPFFSYTSKILSKNVLSNVKEKLCEVHRDAVCFSHWHENHWPTFNDKKQSCDRRTTPRRPRETMGECDDREVTYSPEKPRS